MYHSPFHMSSTDQEQKAATVDAQGLPEPGVFAQREYIGPSQPDLLPQIQYQYDDQYTTPPSNQYVPPPGQCAPPPSQYVPPLNQYSPPPNQYSPPSNQYPAASQYTPLENYNTAPPSNQYAPAASQYVPLESHYTAPPSDRYAPSASQHISFENQYTGPSNQYAPSANQYIPLENAPSNQYAPGDSSSSAPANIPSYNTSSYDGPPLNDTFEQGSPTRSHLYEALPSPSLTQYQLNTAIPPAQHSQQQNLSPDSYDWSQYIGIEDPDVAPYTLPPGGSPLPLIPLPLLPFQHEPQPPRFPPAAMIHQLHKRLTVSGITMVGL